MTRLFLAFAFLAGPAFAHPHHYTEQQVSLTLGLDGIVAEISIIPSDVKGAKIFAALDGDGDGVLTKTEMQALASEALAATLLTVDGAPQALSLDAINSPDMDDMAAGHATITIRASVTHVLTAGETVEFSIGYDRFERAWSVQPWLANGFPADGQLPVVRRSDDNAAVSIALPGA